MKRLVVLLLLLAGCESTPTPMGPGLLVLPGSGKTFDVFRADDAECRQYAGSQLGDTSSAQPAEVQRRYDFSYTQCMYSKGHRVPVAGRYSDSPAPRHNTAAPPPPPPPPPQGTPPGPPPDYKGN